MINNYNYSQFLRQAIDSALSQTYPDTEVIVVDDGSSDRSPEIISTYGSRIIPLLKNNGGQASAMNAGFQASSGDIVIFLDADDYLFPHAAEKVVAAWEAGLAKVHYRLELVDVNGKFIDIFPPPEVRLDRGAQVLTNLLEPGRYSTTVTSSNAFSRTALTAIFPIPEENYRIAADGYLVTLVSFYGRVTNIETSLGAYRQHNRNLWSTREELSATKFRKYINHDFKKYNLLQVKATELGYKTSQNLEFGDYHHLTSRIASWCLDPENHPVASDSSLNLVYRGYLAVWKYSDFSWKRKLILSTWFVWVGLLPPHLAKPAIDWLFASRSRPKAVDWVVKKLRWLTSES